MIETICSKKKRARGNQISKRNFLPNTEQSIGQVITAGQVFSEDIWAEILDTGDLDECWTPTRMHIEHEAYSLRWGVAWVP